MHLDRGGVGFGETRAPTTIASALLEKCKPPTSGSSFSAPTTSVNSTIVAAYRPNSRAERLTVHTDALPPHAVALRLGDDSMAERFPAGSIVVIVDTESPDTNDFVVGVLPGAQTASMRQWVEAADRRFLVPLNRAYQATEVTADFRLLGVVVEVLSFFPSTFRPSP